MTVTEKSQWKHQEDVKTQKVNKSLVILNSLLRQK